MKKTSTWTHVVACELANYQHQNTNATTKGKTQIRQPDLSHKLEAPRIAVFENSVAPVSPCSFSELLELTWVPTVGMILAFLRPWFWSSVTMGTHSWPLSTTEEPNGCSKHAWVSTVASGLRMHKEKKVCCWVANLLAEYLREQRNSPMADHFWVQIWPQMGSRIGSHFHSFFSGLCLGPILGPDLDQKWGQPSENLSAAPRSFTSRFATH